MNKLLRNEKGFTLVEMIVVIVLVAILAAVAIPAYSSYAIKGRASEANNIVGSLVSAAEGWYQANNTFVGFNTSAQWTSITGRTRYFTFAASGITATAITITATGNGTNGVTTASTLTATMADMSAANPQWTWTAAGYCTASS